LDKASIISDITRFLFFVTFSTRLAIAR
jgi:hypothetical protein